MLIDASQALVSDLPRKAEICIIGAGVAGITLANELAGLGRQVVVLESGGRYYSAEKQELYAFNQRPEFFPNPSHSRLRMLGGSSNHWENSVERFTEIDFVTRPWVPNSGWPIAFSEVETFYSRAEKYCCVDSAPYSFDEWAGKSDVDLLSGSANFDTVVSKGPKIPTRFGTVHLDKASRSGNVDVIYNADFLGVDFDEKEGRVVSARVLVNGTERVKLATESCVLAMGGIENARMLLVINEEWHRRAGNQFDNVGRYFMEHPTIRAAHLIPFNNAKLSEIYKGVAREDMNIRARASLREQAQKKNSLNNLRLYFNEKTELDLSDGVAAAHILRDSLSEGSLPENFGHHLVNLLGDTDLLLETLLDKKDIEPSFLSASDTFGGYELIAMIEQTPDRENRIGLSKQRDALGIPRPILNYRVTDSDREAAWKTLQLLSTDVALTDFGRLKVLKSRASRVWQSQLGYGQHHIGSTRMSESEQDGVVDSNLRVFGTRNLFVTGSSVFPTGSHVPPTLTIAALTIRLAQHLNTL